MQSKIEVSREHLLPSDVFSFRVSGDNNICDEWFLINNEISFKKALFLLNVLRYEMLYGIFLMIITRKQLQKNIYMGFRMKQNNKLN